MFGVKRFEGALASIHGPQWHLHGRPEFSLSEINLRYLPHTSLPPEVNTIGTWDTSYHNHVRSVGEMYWEF